MALKRKTIVSTTLIDLLKVAKQPLSIKQLTKQLAMLNLHPNKTTLYRQMDKLVDMNMVSIITLNNGISYFELRHKGHHHHHFFCNSCHELFCLNDCHVNINQIDLNTLLPSPSFKITNHDFKLYGTCESCHQKENKKERPLVS